MCVLICLWEPIQGDAHKSEWRDLNGDTNSLQSTVTNASSWWHHAVILAFRFMEHIYAPSKTNATLGYRKAFLHFWTTGTSSTLPFLHQAQTGEPHAMGWAGGLAAGPKDRRTCRTEVRHHSVTTAGLRGSSRLCSLQPRAGALSFLCSFCM